MPLKSTMKPMYCKRASLWFSHVCGRLGVGGGVTEAGRGVKQLA